MTKPHLGSRLAALRQAKDWTRYRLWKESGVAASHIDKIERGETVSPGIAILQKLADALDVGVGELFGETPR